MVKTNDGGQAFPVGNPTHGAVHGHALKFYWKDDSNRAKTCWFEWV